ncbi:hypothetical protein QF030_002237 [Streptomyces rishiriensis]|uniref:Uncharacterized protein n=1 Tax=Streptomyces rishiriensis TaxID=68264 RepID=A0ABU0NLT6_STRRH|nr:hypothetical protein [Streptomyces rishiriensis]
MEGALGAVVLADTRRIEECSPAVGCFEAQGVPFVQPGVAGTASGLNAEVPVLECDARERDSVRDVLGVLADRVVAFRAVPGRKVVVVR